MTFIQPTSWPEALQARAEHPDAVPVAGGTDILVEINFDRRHPSALLDLNRVPELRLWGREHNHVRLGSGLTYTEIISHLGKDLPGLAMAARAVASPPIRNRGTIGGNLGSASPAGDCHPPLLAARAEVEVASASRSRTIPISQFFTGPKRNVLCEDELIAAVWVPVATGPQVFAKVGTRNAMVIAVCSFALALHPPELNPPELNPPELNPPELNPPGGNSPEGPKGRVGTGIGSAGPVPLQAHMAQQFLEGHLEETGAWESKAPLSDSVLARFGQLVAEAARPIDDVRATAAYRRRALEVLGRRTLSWCWDEYREGGS
jgi:CO/xanthine dehydrogenase FAD-binding subunit